MTRGELIDAALARRNFGPQLRGRVERLLDGAESCDRLYCCNSGCFVCVQELKVIVTEVEEALARLLTGESAKAGKQAAAGDPAA